MCLCQPAEVNHSFLRVEAASNLQLTLRLRADDDGHLGVELLLHANMFADKAIMDRRMHTD